MALQINDFEGELDNLQRQFGNPNICSINGAGCIKDPKILFLFMNPTARNITADPAWTGLRAPWIGTKNIWKMIYKLDLISEDQLKKIQESNKWTVEFATNIYQTLSDNRIYITNLAKCTQDDARPLKNSVFQKYLELTRQEVLKVNPEKIVSFGVQVSSVLLNKKVELKDNTEEKIIIGGKEFRVYPTYYPVGQGMRNMGKAVERILGLLG
jgi:uracil-DNA glycosylase